MKINKTLMKATRKDPKNVKQIMQDIYDSQIQSPSYIAKQILTLDDNSEKFRTNMATIFSVSIGSVCSYLATCIYLTANYDLPVPSDSEYIHGVSSLLSPFTLYLAGNIIKEVFFSSDYYKISEIARKNRKIIEEGKQGIEHDITDKFSLEDLQ